MANNICTSRKRKLNIDELKNRDQLKEVNRQPGLSNNINNIMTRILLHNHPCFPHVGSSPQRAIEYWKPKLMDAILSGSNLFFVFFGTCGLFI